MPPPPAPKTGGAHQATHARRLARSLLRLALGSCAALVLLFAAASLAPWCTLTGGCGAAAVPGSHANGSNTTSSSSSSGSSGAIAAAAAAAGTPPSAAAAPPWQRPGLFNASQPIPWQLWQTSRSSRLSPRAAAAAESWRRLNPLLQVTLQNDSEAAAFIDATYGPAVGATFRSFPLGVMRADFWRYAVLYARGGVYADTDVQCLAPLLAWFPPRPQQQGEPAELFPGGLAHDKLGWHDCSIIIGLENAVDFCQWAIASVPGHPVLETVIQLVLERAAGGFNTSYEHLVHMHTGPAVWTEAVRLSLGLPAGSAAQVAAAVWTQPAAYRRARALGVCIVAAPFYGGSAAQGVRPQNAMNLYGSQSFQGAGEEDYPRWIVEAAELRQRQHAQQAAAGGVPAAAAGTGRRRA